MSVSSRSRMRRSLREARSVLSTRWRSSVARSWLSEKPRESSTRAAVLVTKAPQRMHIPFHAVGCAQCLGSLDVVLAMALSSRTREISLFVF